MTAGATVVVFGKHVVTVTAVSENGKRAHVSGAGYSGWTATKNLKAAS